MFVFYTVDVDDITRMSASVLLTVAEQAAC